MWKNYLSKVRVIQEFRKRFILPLSNETKVVTPAMKSPASSSAQIIHRSGPGGIDLTAKRMKLEVETDKAAVSEPMDLKQLENIEINGLYIKKIEIKPMKNLPEFLGVTSN